MPAPPTLTPQVSEEPIPVVGEADGVAAAAGDAGVPGRTRPRFEELPPGPPTWPGWAAIVVGSITTILGYSGAILAMRPGSAVASGIGAGVAALAGVVLVVAGIVWLAIAGILRRRVLPDDRYRGASLIDLLLIVILGGNLAALPVLLLVMRGDPNRLEDPAVITVELLVTPVAFLAVYGLFVALPRALPGVRLWTGWRSVVQLLIGMGIGLAVWIGMGLLSELVNLIVTALTGKPLGGEQAVVGLAQQVPLVTAVIAVAVLAPVAEELFFRGAVLNGWEREYGTSRAVMGSSVLFALVHIVGGTPLAVAQVFLLGLILGTVYTRTRTLATTIGLHGAFNLASVLALFLLT